MELTEILLNIERFLPAILIVLTTLVAAFMLRWGMQRYLSRVTNRARVFADISWLAVIVIGFIAFVYITETDPGIILLVGSLVATTASFAFTDVLQQWLSQGRIAFDQHLKIGDLISTGDHSGYVREITSSSLVLETADRELVVIPASQVVENDLVNHSAIPGAPVVVNFPIYAPNVPRWQIKKALLEVVNGYNERLEGEEFEPEVHHKIEDMDVWTVVFFVQDSFSSDAEATDVSLMGAERLESMGALIGQMAIENA